MLIIFAYSQNYLHMHKTIYMVSQSIRSFSGDLTKALGKLGNIVAETLICTNPKVFFVFAL